MDDDPVFKALADRHRRSLLDALFVSDGQSLTALCGVLPELTRFGVMKHLAVLADAGLVVSRRSGRSKYHYLNPFPIREIHDRWISKYATITLDALTGLKRTVEGACAGSASASERHETHAVRSARVAGERNERRTS